MSDINLAAVTRNIIMEQGASIDVPFAVTRNSVAIDLTGYDVRLQVRRSYKDTSTLINATLANGKMVWVSQSAGAFKLSLSPSDSASIRFNSDEVESIDAVYDLELQSPTGVVFKGCKGSFTINREVTR